MWKDPRRKDLRRKVQSFTLAAGRFSFTSLKASQKPFAKSTNMAVSFSGCEICGEWPLSMSLTIQSTPVPSIIICWTGRGMQASFKVRIKATRPLYSSLSHVARGHGEVKEVMPWAMAETAAASAKSAGTSWKSGGMRSSQRRRFAAGCAGYVSF